MPRRPKPSDTQAFCVIPTAKIGMVIGKQGANIKQLQTTYDVAIDIPQDQGGLEVELTISGGDPNGAVQSILQMVESSGPGGGGDRGGGNRLGGFNGGGNRFGNGRGGNFSSGGMGASGQYCNALLFRVNPDGSNQLQLLLHHKNNSWNVTAGKLNQDGDDDSDTKSGAYRLLTESCGGDNPPLADLLWLEPLHLKTKTIHHILVPPDGPWPEWEPTPGPGARGYTDAELYLGGVLHQSVNAHCWVNVSILQADVASANPSVDKNVVLWFQHNADNLLPKISGNYENCVISAGSNLSGWTDTEAGKKVVANLKQLVDFMAALPSDDFIQLADTCFDPQNLLEVFEKYQAHGGELPNATSQI
eukprot:m.157817 g.157817  ORF g.157817 m.157817 type:complete len:361 (-) comp24734_c0_seq9:180-1262(-)